MLPFLASSLRPITRRALVDLSTAGVAGAAGIATPARAFEIPLPSFGADPEKTARLRGGRAGVVSFDAGGRSIERTAPHGWARTTTKSIVGARPRAVDHAGSPLSAEATSRRRRRARRADAGPGRRGRDVAATSRRQRELKAAPVDPEVRACGSRMVTLRAATELCGAFEMRGLGGADRAAAGRDLDIPRTQVGTYTDPMHPGCTRRVAQIAGTKFASIRGADEDGIPWVAGANVACADYNGVGKEQLIVDFTAKGGPKDVVAVADYSETSCKLTFPDGNVWTMVPCSSPNLKTKQQVAACEAAAKG